LLLSFGAFNLMLLLLIFNKQSLIAQGNMGRAIVGDGLVQALDATELVNEGPLNGNSGNDNVEGNRRPLPLFFQSSANKLIYNLCSSAESNDCSTKFFAC
jgi:hypothetical protein